MTETQVAELPTSVEVELRPLSLLPRQQRPAYALARRGRFGGGALFGLTVFLPLTIGGVYLFAIAAPRYASEASYIVRSAGAGASAGSGVSSLMQTRGVSRAVDETYAITEYLDSPEVVAKLVSDNQLREVLARPEADMFNRYPPPFSADNMEALRRRVESMLTQTIDAGSGISRLEVVAFRPEDAREIAEALIIYAEEMVNRLNERAYRDELASANRFVDQAMGALRDTEAALTSYRDVSGSVDPASDAASTMKVIQTLTIQLSRLEASILEQEAMAPLSPQSTTLRQRANSLRQEIGGLKLKLTGAGPSASSKLGEFEELVLRRELAAKSLETAVQSRDKAREEAENQHLYVQVIRAPSVPDVARYPRRFVDFGFLLAVSLMVYFVTRSFSRAAREHRV